MTGSLSGGSIGKTISDVTNSHAATAASDAVKRVVGVDIRRAMGGKTAVEIAEERLRKSQMENGGGYGGGY